MTPTEMFAQLLVRCIYEYRRAEGIDMAYCEDNYRDLLHAFGSIPANSIFEKQP